MRTATCCCGNVTPPTSAQRPETSGVLAYKNEAIAETSEPGSPDVLTTHSEVKAGQGSGSYLAQALGIRLARAQGKNFYTMLLYGRLANLILYLLLAALAVWLAPTSLRRAACLRGAAAHAAAIGGQPFPGCRRAGAGVQLHGALPAPAGRESCLVAEDPAHWCWAV